MAAGPDAVVGEVTALIAELAAASPAAGVGLVVPGIVDAAGGRAVFSANVGFRDLPLRDLVRDAVGLPVLLEHDVYAAGVAERAVGAAAGIDDHLVAVIGTGIAGVLHVGRAARARGSGRRRRARSHPRVARRRALPLRPAGLPGALCLRGGDLRAGMARSAENRA